MKKQIVEINQKYKYKINIKHPVTLFKNINDIIKKEINNIKNNFIDISKRSVQLNMYYTLYITFKEFITNETTSYVFEISEYTGGAHNINTLYSITFDFEGNVITIDSLLKNNQNILAIFSNYSRKKLLSIEEFKDSNITSMVLDGTRPIKENFKNFAFTKKGILIFFDYYQVAPYYFGIQKVLIPYDLIS